MIFQDLENMVFCAVMSVVMLKAKPGILKCAGGIKM